MLKRYLRLTICCLAVVLITLWSTPATAQSSRDSWGVDTVFNYFNLNQRARDARESQLVEQWTSQARYELAINGIIKEQSGQLSELSDEEKNALIARLETIQALNELQEVSARQEVLLIELCGTLSEENQNPGASSYTESPAAANETESPKTPASPPTSESADRANLDTETTSEATTRNQTLSSFDLTWLQQLTLYLSVVVGVMFSSALKEFRAGEPVRFRISPIIVIVAALVALILIPTIYENLAIDPESPVIVQLGLFVGNGVFWENILDAVSKANQVVRGAAS